MGLKPFFSTIYFGEMLIPAIEREQDIFYYKIGELKKYRPRTENNTSDKNKVLTNAKNFYDGREMTINAFKNKLFPLYSGNYYEEFKEKTSKSGSEDILPRDATAASPRSSLDSSRSSSPINNEGLDPKIINHYFGFNSLNEIYEFLNEDSVDKGSDAAAIDQTLNNLKPHIKTLSKEGKQTSQVKLLANSVDKIFNDAIDEAFNKIYNDVFNKQQGQGLKILTPQQMITRLPIVLVQLKAGNNSQKFKNEIRQIVYSLYRSKNLSKTIYNSLLNTI